MPNKSLYQQISNPIETYTDGYGQTREVYEPKYVGVLRKAYNLANRFLNGPSEEEYHNIGMKKPLEGLGILEFLTLPEASVLKSIKVTSTKNLLKTYKEAASEFKKLIDIRKIRGKWSKQEQSRFDFLTDIIGNIENTANEVANIRTRRAWKTFNKELEAAKKSPKPEMVWSDYEQANVPSWNLWKKPERTPANLEEMWELMYKNTEMGERAAVVKKESERLKQLDKEAKDANNYLKWASNPEATINYSVGFFTDGFHYKQGGIIKRK